jgi:mycothiol synthase
MRKDLTGRGARPAAAAGDAAPRWALRPFAPGRDEDGWLALNAEAFAGHPEQGRLTRADLEARMAEPWFDPEAFLLAVPAGSGPAGSGPAGSGLAGSGPAGSGPAEGFIWTKMPPGQGAEGEIYAVGVRPAAQGRGLGGVLTRAGVDVIAARGFAAAVLYVEADNAPALAAYRAAGFEVAARDIQYEYAGATSLGGKVPGFGYEP